MKMGFTKIAMAIGAVVLSGSAMAIEADASASIVNPISVAQGTALNFGTINTDATGGSVTLTAAATTVASKSGTGVVAPSNASSGVFNVTGGAANTYAITVDSSVTLTHTDTATTISATLTKSKDTGTLSASGADSFYVGGTLTIGANQKNGSYSGKYAVTVAYN